MNRRLCLTTAALLAVLAAPRPVGAAPTGAVVAAKSVGGGAAVSVSGAMTTITQSSQRVVIDWSSFNIAQGESVVFQQPSSSAIALNRIASAATIDGALSANGGLWLLSPGGLIFGSHAQVNAGQFVASTATLPNSLLAGAVDPGSGLDLSLNSPGGSLTVQTGATITASGTVLLHGSSLSQAGAVRGGGGVGYLAADDARLTSAIDGSGAKGAPASTAAAGAPSLSHTGSTVAGGPVRVFAQAPASGRTSVINLDGSIEADGMAASSAGVVIGSGDGTGAGVRLTATARIITDGGFRAQVDTATLGPIAAHGDISVDTLNAATASGSLSSGGDVRISSNGAGGSAVRVAAPITAIGDIELSSLSGDVSVEAALTGGGVVDAFAQRDIAVSATTVQGGASGAPTGGVFLTAGRNVTTVPTTLLLAGPSEAAPGPGVVEILAGDSAGGSADVGRVISGDVIVAAIGATGAGGQVTTRGDVVASRSVFLQSFGDGTAGAQGGVSTLAGVSGASDVLVQSTGGGDVDVGPASAVSGATLTVASLRNITVEGEGALTSRGGLSVSAEGAFTVGSGAQLVSGGAVSEWSWPVARWSDTDALILRATTVSLAGDVRAGPAGGGDLIVRLLGTPQIGDATGVTSSLSNASAQHLFGGRVAIVGETGADMTVGDLSLSAQRTPVVWFGPAEQGSLILSGSVAAPGVSLALGLVHDSSTAGEDFLPQDVRITGSIGASGAATGSVRVAAARDVLIGSSGFVQAASADPQFDAVTRSGGFPTPVTPGAAQITAADIQFVASQRVIEQNTGGGHGLAVGAPTADLPLVSTSNDLGVTNTPGRIDLFAVFTSSTGGTQSGVLVARNSYLLPAGVTPTESQRVNACPFGTGAQCLGQSTVAAPSTVLSSVFVQSPTNSPLLLDEAPAKSPTASTAVATVSPTATTSVLFLPPPTPTETERDALAALATGSGNGDLWNQGGRKGKKP